MKITAPDLAQFFIAHLQRYSSAHVTVNTTYENKHIVIQRDYNGPAKPEQLMKDAVNSELLPEHMYPGSVHLDNFEVSTFLNAAWEELHNAKTKEIALHVTNQQQHPGPVDAHLAEHGMLLRQSPLYEERDTSAGTNLSFATYRQEVTSPASKIFVLGDEMTAFGKPCIINATLEGYTTSVMGGAVRPDISRIVRFVNTAELSTFITLAENSRYSAGVLGRTRIWNDVDGFEHDVIEVFYNDQRTTWLPFWNSRNLYLTIFYIQYPKPLSIPDITGTDKEGRVLETKNHRVVECDYAMQIAELATMKALKLAAAGSR